MITKIKEKDYSKAIEDLDNLITNKEEQFKFKAKHKDVKIWVKNSLMLLAKPQDMKFLNDECLNSGKRLCVDDEGVIHYFYYSDDKKEVSRVVDENEAVSLILDGIMTDLIFFDKSKK